MKSISYLYMRGKVTSSSHYHSVKLLSSLPQCVGHGRDCMGLLCSADRVDTTAILVPQNPNFAGFGEIAQSLGKVKLQIRRPSAF